MLGLEGVGKNVYISVTEFIRPNDKRLQLAMKRTSKQKHVKSVVLIRRAGVGQGSER